MKPTVFVTTFSKECYTVYGKNWIDGFVNHTNNVSAVIYTDGHLNLSNDRITVVDFNKEIPQHKEWADNFYTTDTVSKAGYKHLGIKFSYKTFVMLDMLTKFSNKYIVWLDGDCEFKQYNDFNNFIPNVLTDKFVACQVEKGFSEWRGDKEHIESGILIFDSAHPDKIKFVNELKIMYAEHIKTLEKPYDGFLIKQALDNTGIEYIDLFPSGYTTKSSAPADTTFIHPEINCRFRHNMYKTISKPFFEYKHVQ